MPTRTIVLELDVYDNGKVEIKNENQGGISKPLSQLLTGSPSPIPVDLNVRVRGHNAIGVLVSNPTCFVINGKLYCF